MRNIYEIASKMSTETEQIFLLNVSENQLSSSSQRTLVELAGAPGNDLENVEDFSQVCRTCASVTEFQIPMFEGEGLQNKLADKINEHLPIQVSPADALPTALCVACANTLLAWHELARCARRADAALRRRGEHLRAAHEQNATKNEKCKDPENTEQKECEENLNSEKPPPRYKGTVPVMCAYCGLQQPTDTYKEHLISIHSDLLFHCVECDTYVDRKEFITHMSLHAAQYVSKQAESKQIEDSPEKAKVTTKEKDVNENTEPSNQQHNAEAEEMVVEIAQEKADDCESNEFSDHSDTESGFGPLPESVFEAIEDSQESQLDNSAEIPDNESTHADSNDNLSDNDEEDIDSSVKKKKKSNKPRTCPVCAKVYTVRSSYFYHVKYGHQQTKDHECKECGQKFATKYCLNQHASIHTGDCPYACDECKKTFRTKASLYIHKQAHSGLKKFQCAQCPAAFRWRTHLKRHITRHSAEKTHECETCGRAFSLNYDLLRHKRTHAVDNVFECVKCGGKYSQLRYFKDHMERRHPEERVERLLAV